jgi:hypothetical protein
VTITSDALITTNPIIADLETEIIDRLVGDR